MSLVEDGCLDAIERAVVGEARLEHVHIVSQEQLQLLLVFQ